MAKYLFKCFKCSNVEEKEKSMNDFFDIKDLVCNKCGNVLNRDYNGEISSKSMIIPEEHKGINQTKVQFDYGKSPSKRKRFF